MKKITQIGRREFIAVSAGAVASAAVAMPTRAGSVPRKSKEMLLYVGTYTTGESKSKGIYIHRFDGSAGTLTPYKVVEGVEEPSFLAIDPNGRYVFAVNETLHYEGKKSGAVSSFEIDQKTGDLRFISKVASLGAAPCHITVSADGKFVLVANYIGGNVAVFPVEPTGRLGTAVSMQQHSGFGPNKDRQEAAHAHSVILDNENRYAFVNDLGIDRIMIYAFEQRTGKLTPNKRQPFYSTVSGAGPRHFKFHPNGRFAVVLNELNMTVTSLGYDASAGSLKQLHTLSILPEDFKGENTCADIHISQDGKFVYASNRGHDSIAVFAFDGFTGRMERVEIVPTGGKIPRNFAIDPTGNYLLAANQDSDSIVVFSIDKTSGRLRNTGRSIATPQPVCLKFHAV